MHVPLRNVLMKSTGKNRLKFKIQRNCRMKFFEQKLVMMEFSCLPIYLDRKLELTNEHLKNPGLSIISRIPTLLINSFVVLSSRILSSTDFKVLKNSVLFFSSSKLTHTSIGQRKLFMPHEMILNVEPQRKLH